MYFRRQAIYFFRAGFSSVISEELIIDTLHVPYQMSDFLWFSRDHKILARFTNVHIHSLSHNTQAFPTTLGGTASSGRLLESA